MKKMTKKQRRSLRVLGLLSRPVMTESHVTAMKRIISSPSWSPLPHLPNLNLLEPLFRHHLKVNAISQESVFLSYPENQLPVPENRELAMSYYARRIVMDDLWSSVNDSGIGKIVLLKGSSIERKYPAPLLRQMCDIDVLLKEEDLYIFRELLSDQGWKKHCHEASEVWIHEESTLLLDVHLPGSAFSETLYGQAIPLEDQDYEFLYQPREADHVIVLAMHCASNGGARIWRDLTDLHAVAGSEITKDLLAESLSLAERFGYLGSVLPFTMFYLRYGIDRRPSELVEVVNQYLKKTDSKSVVQKFMIYESISLEGITQAELGLLYHISDSPMEIFSYAVSRLSPLKQGKAKSYQKTRNWQERDPVHGNMPKSGTWKRDLLRLKLLLNLVMSGKFFYYRQLARRSMDMGKGSKVFTASLNS